MTSHFDNHSPQDNRPIRLLFVDDEPAAVGLAEHALRQMGYDFTGSTSSRDALNMIQEDPQRFDVIVSDLSMPPPSGDQMIRIIHRMRPDMPVVLISGHDNTITGRDAQNLNVVAFLAKPFHMEELDERIRSLLCIQ